MTERRVVFSWAAECGAKKSYETKREAKHAARWAETLLGGGRLQPYACSWSADGDRHYHVGHPPHPDAIAAALQQLAKRTRRS